MGDSTDIVVVGGGIAGSAFAKAASERGLRVTVLERQTAYRDKVRGEFMHPWGVAEARRLGVEDALLGSGGTWITEAIGYDELLPPAAAEARPVQLADFRPDVPGAMDLGHPQACQALASAAAEAGSDVVRGVGDVIVTAGPSPLVRYELDDVEHEVRCRLVVAADGRASSIRRQLGLSLTQTEPKTMGGGMLIEGLDAWPPHRMSLGTEDDSHYLVFPREGGIARLYLLYPIEQKTRFTGPDRQRDFLDSFRLRCLPLGEMVAASTPAGPCAMYPMNDSWTDRVAVPGVVLVGDAAGWNDPIIGEGLSIALRDARTVSDVVTSSDDWSPGAFDAYGAERKERMRRLCIGAQIQTALRCDFTPRGRARRGAFLQQVGADPMLLAPTLLSFFAGPEAAPAEAFDDANIQRIYDLG
jgi:2-polyprenyl-6-methoxyphenol hydroxylase-like FAD-dependent oxidoreductase